MKIKLYNFSKPSNSLAVPGTADIEYDCQIKTPSSIANPSVQLAKSAEPLGYNYAYIPDFGRYYFINDITYGIGVWLIDLTVDVLASFRADILNSTQYVLRNTSEYNGNILDNLYTTEAQSTGNSAKATASGTVTDPDAQLSYASYFNVGFTSGYFIVGVISNNGSGVSYYQFTYSGFSTFVANLMNYLPTDIDDVSDGLKKAFFDPMQYITTCYWYPVSMARGTIPVTSNIFVGGYAIPVGGIANIAPITNRGIHLRTSVTVPKNPQATDRPYTQLEPYSRYNLVFEPFGNIPLDTAKMYGATSLTLDWYTDVATGMGELFITSPTGALIANRVSMLGVQVQLSQLTVDYIGGLGSAISAVAGASMSLDPANIAKSLVSGIGNVVNSISPQVSTTGANGSFLPYSVGAPVLYAHYLAQVDTDPTHRGRPLCQNKLLSTLTGFTVCQNAKVAYSTANPLSYEVDEIETALNAGVYIE